MGKIIFASYSSGKDFGLVLWAASIRKFAGSLSNSSIWVIIPDSKKHLDKNVETELLSLDVKIINLETDLEDRNFPFLLHVKAAATLESLVDKGSEFLIWMISDTLILNEPLNFILDEGKNIGYRPVHHTLVGSIYNEPIDPFWSLVYQKCNVPEDKIFPMNTHVDHNVLRPYFNAGFLIVRTPSSLLQDWYDQYQELYKDLSFQSFYQKNDLYAIFIHQAILAGVILSQMEISEPQGLPFTYNYPLHLLSESPEEYQPKNLNGLVTIRYEKFSILGNASFDVHIKKWISQQLKHFSNLSGK